MKFRYNCGNTAKNEMYLYTLTQPDDVVNLNLSFNNSQAGHTGKKMFVVSVIRPTANI